MTGGEEGATPVVPELFSHPKMWYSEPRTNLSPGVIAVARSEVGRINVIGAMKLMVLWLLANPKKVGEGVPYPQKQRRGQFPNYYAAYKANGGWTGQELMELIEYHLGTEWKPNSWTIYNAVLGGENGLVHYEWVKMRQEEPGQNFTVAWYCLNDDELADPSRPARRAIEQDKENLAQHLKRVLRWIRAIDNTIYHGRLFDEVAGQPPRCAKEERHEKSPVSDL